MSTYVITDRSLPRSLDVQISLSKPSAEVRTNLSVMCLVGSGLGFYPDANRIRYYSDITAVGEDFAPSAQAYIAAQAFFGQSPRPSRMAIGEAFLTPQPAYLASAPLSASQLSALASVGSGSMDVTYNPGSGPIVQSFTGVSFIGITTIEQVAAALQDHAGDALACAVKTLPGGSKVVTISTVATGDGVTISFPTAPEAGTDIRAMLNMTLATNGKSFGGYAPTGIAGELDNVVAAANSNGIFCYGWALTSELRNASVYQEPAARWALAQKASFMGLVTNDPAAYDPAVTTDLGTVVNASGNRRVTCLYHDNPVQYPEVSILAYMLSVNYQIQNSTVTAKFKQLPGISTVQLTETQWAALQEKGYNTYTAVGNSSRTFREGNSEDPSYFMDDTINLDNFVEDLSVAVYNVFLQHKKIPYTSAGQMLLVDACVDVGNQYIYNGTFADRLVSDTSVKSGVSVVPGVQVIPTPIQNMSAADRASRVGPPIDILGQLAGAIHSVAISVEVVS